LEMATKKRRRGLPRLSIGFLFWRIFKSAETTFEAMIMSKRGQ
jgi:hypothetical protein